MGGDWRPSSQCGILATNPSTATTWTARISQVHTQRLEVTTNSEDRSKQAPLMPKWVNPSPGRHLLLGKSLALISHRGNNSCNAPNKPSVCFYGRTRQTPANLPGGCYPRLLGTGVGKRQEQQHTLRPGLSHWGGGGWRGPLGRIGASKVRRGPFSKGIDMALSELACNRRPDPAHPTPSSLVPGRAFSSLPLLRARTRGRARMRE